jgi:hypothetical protein
MRFLPSAPHREGGEEVNKAFPRIFIAVLVLACGIAAWQAVSNGLESRERSRLKTTMAAMRDAGQRFEQGQPFTPMNDEWGNPVRIEVRGRRYSLRSAGSDGVFETGNPRGDTEEAGADIVFADGNFLQGPGGRASLP